jgi:hypothetical protein
MRATRQGCPAAVGRPEGLRYERPPLAVAQPFRAAFVVLLAMLAMSACSAGSSPTSPRPTPPPTADGIAITSGDDALRTGFFADFTVTATMSDRTTQIVTRQAALSTSDPAIATIDANGRVTAIRHGTVALNATYQGRSTSRTISIVHDYAGLWNGTFVIRACDQTGVFASSRYCQNAGVEPLPMALDLTQTGARVDRISGSISLRGLAGPVTGEVTADGRLVLSGSYVATAPGGSLRIEILTWSTTAVGGTTMSGTFAYNVSLVGAEGSANQTNEIVTVVKRPE